MTKPKLIKVPRNKAQETEEGLLIKINDEFFVLVESLRHALLSDTPSSPNNIVFTNSIGDTRTASKPRWTVIAREFVGIQKENRQFNHIIDHVREDTTQAAMQIMIDNGYARGCTVTPLFIFPGHGDPVWMVGQAEYYLDDGKRDEKHTLARYTLIIRDLHKQLSEYSLRTIEAENAKKAMEKRDAGEQVLFIFRGQMRALWQK